jgi:ABC-type branched-subunit amino acid transport system substrate-binding protein
MTSVRIRRRQHLVLLGASLAMPGAPAAGAPPHILVGQSVALSGPLSLYGREKADGVKLAFDAVNAQGGIRGRKVELVVLDDGYDPKRTVQNTRDLASRHQVQALVGYLGVPTIEASLPVFEELKVPVVGLTSGSSSLRMPHRRYVFPVRAPYTAEASHIVRHLQTIGVSRVAIAHHDDSFGEMGASAYQSALKAAGLAAAQTVNVDRGGTDAAPAAAVLDRARPQAVLLFLQANAAAELVKAYRRQGGGASFYSASIVAANQLITAGGSAVTGMAISQVVPLPSEGTLALTRHYRRLVEASPGARASLYGLEGFVEASLLIEALKRAPGATSPDIVRALEGLGGFDIGGYPLRYGPGDRTGSSYIDMTVVSGGGVLRR